MSWPFVSLGCVCFFVFDITIMLCLLEGSLTFGLCQSAIWKCVLSQTKLLEEVIVCSVTGDIAPVVSQSGTQGNNLSFSSITIKINYAPPRWFLSFYLFYHICIVKSYPPPLFFSYNKSIYWKTTWSIVSPQTKCDLFWFSTRCKYHANT